MATRFNLQSVTGADVTPSIPAGWLDTSSASFFKLFRTPQSTATNSKQVNDTSATNPFPFLHLVYVSEPLAPHAISGSIKGQMMALESSADCDFSYGFRARIVSRDGTVNRGTLFDNLSSLSIGTEYSLINRANRHFPPSNSIASIACQRGDRLVLEFGTIAFNSFSASRAAALYYGDGGVGGDLPENEADTDTTKNPWVEFSHDFRWESNMEDGEGTSTGGSTAFGTAQAKAQTSAISAGGSTASGVSHADARASGTSSGSSTAVGSGETKIVTLPNFIVATPKTKQLAAGSSIVLADERFAYVTMIANGYPIHFT